MHSHVVGHIHGNRCHVYAQQGVQPRRPKRRFASSWPPVNSTLGFSPMSEPKPFIPNDKPKSWVIFILAGLIGLAVGLVGFAAAWAGISWLKRAAIFIFVLCWLVSAATWLVFIFGLLTGRYKNIQPREWSEQLW